MGIALWALGFGRGKMTKSTKYEKFQEQGTRNKESQHTEAKVQKPKAQNLGTRKYKVQDIV